jgi:hypothetical protein
VLVVPPPPDLVSNVRSDPEEGLPSDPDHAIDNEEPPEGVADQLSASLVKLKVEPDVSAIACDVFGGISGFCQILGQPKKNHSVMNIIMPSFLPDVLYMVLLFYRKTTTYENC